MYCFFATSSDVVSWYGSCDDNLNYPSASRISANGTIVCNATCWAIHGDTRRTWAEGYQSLEINVSQGGTITVEISDVHMDGDKHYFAYTGIIIIEN